MLRKNMLTLALILAFAATGAAAQDGDTISVPLSDPSKPVLVQTNLVSGGIKVEAYDGQTVMVRVAELEAVGKKVEKRKEEPRSDGLRRIPNTSHGLTIEEHDNKVSISVNSWSRTTNLEIRVPRRTSLKVRTTNNGDVEVHGVEGDIELGNTNGSITALGISGSVVAHTINGEIKVTLDSVTAGKAMSFSNLNGDIDVTFPADIRADFRMRSDQGDILTDFDVDPVTDTRKSTEGGEGKGFRMKIEKEVHAEVGGGGPEITFKNLNGDILIRKGS